LLDVWRGHISVRKVLNLIDRLPSNSHYIAAIANDEELADGAEGEAAPSAPPLTEWSPVVAALAAVADRLSTLINVQVARGGGQTTKIAPYPRPVTAAQRIKERNKLTRHQELVARLIPAPRTE
jgi:hypothetical protein